MRDSGGRARVNKWELGAMIVAAILWLVAGVMVFLIM
jgi:hypothetical protein